MPTRKKPASGSKRAKGPTTKPGAGPSKKQRHSQTGALSRRGRQTTAQPIAAAARSRVDIGNLGRIWDDIGKREKPKFRVSCMRADDLLVCDFVFENLELDRTAKDGPRLVRTDPNATTTLIVEFPPQSFGEEAFLDKTGVDGQDVPVGEKLPEKYPSRNDPPGLPPPPVPLKPHNVPVKPGDLPPFPPMPSARIRMSGPSRIAFTMPANEAELPLTIAALLDRCRRWPMRLDVNAVPDRLRREAFLAEFGIRDQWLGSVVESSSWARTTEALVNALGREHQRSLAGAARRLSRKTIDAIRSGSKRTERSLRAEFDQELDILARRSRALRDPGRRKIAQAALSMMTTKALTGYRLNQGVFDVFDKLPYLPLIFGPHKPASNVTALELPYRLITSPVPNSRWHHGTAPVVHNGRTELWHTRLTSTDKDIGPDGQTNIRALWSPDYKLNNIVDKVNQNLPFRMSLDPLDREMLVRLMSGFDEENTRNRPFNPTTSRAHQLALSSLGALLHVEGSWYPPVPARVGLEQWRHRATLGRDHYVRVVYRGYLCHPRHPASLIKITERKFEFLPRSRDRVAVLRQRFFIAVRKRDQHYDGRGHKFSGRNFCFTDVEILTEETPTLLAPDDLACRMSDPKIYAGSLPEAPPIPHRACFWPMLGDPGRPNEARNFLFKMAGTDRAGNRVTFEMPLLFVGVEANETAPSPDPPPDPPPPPSTMDRILAAYNSPQERPRRTTFLGGASVCYAPIKYGAKGDPRLPTNEKIFRAARANVPIEEARFHPEVEESECGIAAIQRLLQKPNATVRVKYADIYNQTPGGFGPANSGELFLTLLSPFELQFGAAAKSDAIGGIATPNMSILGFSRIMGPVGAQPPTGSQSIEDRLGKIIGNEFNPADFFKGAKILGGVELALLLDPLLDLAAPHAPKLLSREYDGKIEASFDWATEIKHGDEKGGKAGKFIANAGGPTTFVMQGKVSAPILPAGSTTFNATATISNFKVNLFGAVTLWFDKLVFRTETGAKPDVSVELHPTDQAIEFGGPLEFVNEIRQIIPSNGFSDPPFLTVTPSGISAGYSLSLPSLAVGIFALEHVSLGAGFLLPFDDKPAEVRFNFAERQRPFSLTVSLLGGGGFFAIGLGSEGVREVEAALEFGAALSINLGVASGSVEVKAGIYFHWKTNLVELSGYVRLHGELSVLGLISASLTFNLALGYLKEGNKSVVWGEATLEVEIEILFLSFSVSVSCRREFGGSAGDPKFIELIPDQATWNDYCAAFATEA